ncbi:rho GDP-dissociation inhibitor 1 isoform X1 [Bubalus kerabau]|uniref:rho GDP-dissociation inhibitor 1 isoform X1 n=1 Tax=Bubalus bubalis TaxID=89462 RepID=UPI001D128695|nr:rho GDP-dissociation inhibitor 1 isoform X1 [Bubalus bubalis]XP_055431358.1 rho GDP-dissociation inhibitor 1 isoform X1 [Bubalus carabanensis]
MRYPRPAQRERKSRDPGSGRQGARGRGSDVRHSVREGARERRGRSSERAPPLGPRLGAWPLAESCADHPQVLQKGRWGHTLGPSRLPQPLLPWSQVSHIQLEVSMAEQEPTAEQLAQIAAENEEDEHSVNYKPPAQKSIQEIQELDKDDESLRKYKEALLGRVAVSADPNVPNVVVTRLTLVCSTAPGPLELDLTGDLESFKKQSFVLKEGVEYRIKISFRVNREIVSGMKYIQHTYRKGVKIDKTDYMVGSYGPRAEEYEFLTPMEEAPKGMLARGSYNIKSRFTDDDRTDHLSWEWNLTIKKEWKD